MAYDPTTGIISAPVSIYDVQRVAPVTLRRTVNGVVQTRFSCDLGVLLSSKVGDTIPADDGLGSWTVYSRTDINIWAKYKPVQNTAKQYMSQWDANNNEWDSGATWFHGSGYPAWKFGLVPKSLGITSYTDPAVQTLIDCYNDPDDPMNGWVYKRPLGGSLSPFRLTDFAGYNSMAQKAADEFTVGSPVGLDQNNKGTLVANFVHAIDDGSNVSLYDIIGSSLYFGIIALDSNNNVAIRGTVDTPGVVTIQEEMAFAGENLRYTVYPFFFANRQTWGGAYNSNTLYTIPMVKPVTLVTGSKSQTDIDMMIQGDYYPAGQRTTARIKIHPYTTYTRCWFYLDCGSGNTYTYDVDFVNRTAYITNTHGNGNVHTNRFDLDTDDVDYFITVTGLDPQASYMGQFFVQGNSSFCRRFGIMESIVEQ